MNLKKYKVEKSHVKKRYYKVTYDYLPSDISFWEENKKSSRKDKIKLRYIVKPKKVVNGEVVNAIVEFPDGSCWYYTLC